jgi:hypothetical protein
MLNMSKIPFQCPAPEGGLACCDEALIGGRRPLFPAPRGGAQRSITIALGGPPILRRDGGMTGIKRQLGQSGIRTAQSGVTSTGTIKVE